MSKIENVWALNLQWSYVSWQWRMIQELKRNWLVVSKLTWTKQNLTRTLKKYIFFNWLLVIEVYFVWATKVQRSYFHDTEELCKFWRKTDQCFDKRNEKFGKFSPELLKVSKLELWWDPFVQSRKGMTIKFTYELCVMTMKNKAKFQEELASHF